MKSDVYFIEVESVQAEERLSALKRLIQEVDRFLVYEKDEFIPVKITIGDSPCIYQLSPELVKFIVSLVKKSGAKPFLFDTSVIYKGERQNAVDHLNLVQSKGFGHSRVGAPFIVADGLLGMDGKEINIEFAGVNKIKVPSFIGILQSLLVLSHATGHIVSGYAGAIKNIAMGMVCRPSKQVQHSSLKPSVIEKKCTACGCCIKICPAAAVALKGGKAFIDQQLCLGCGECLCACKFDAIYINWHEDPVVFSRRMVEAAGFILSQFKNKFYINFAFDITKECDCISTQDEKMVSSNLGILASSDILSLDKATVDLAKENGKSVFFREREAVYAKMFEYAAQKGLGNLEYNLIRC